MQEGVVFGFCETAVGLGGIVADALGTPYVHSTRHPRLGQRIIAAFNESHSHAPRHVIAVGRNNGLADAQHVVLVDDEMTTGRTALTVIEQLHASWPKQRYTVAVLLDWRSPADVRAFDDCSKRLDAPIEVVALGTPTNEDIHDSTLGDHEGRLQYSPGTSSEVVEHLFPDVAPVTPFDDEPESRINGAREIAALLRGIGVASVIGTEECMYLPILIAAELGVEAQSTTLSPVVVSTTAGYPIRSVVEFQSPYQLRPAFLYNAQPADHVALVADGGSLEGHRAAARAIASRTGGVVHLVRTGPLAVPPRSTRAMSASVPSSYDREDVEVVIADLGPAELETSLVERERRLHEGGHYSEVLPIEYVPSPMYMEVYQTVLETMAPRIAQAVAVLAERLVEEGEELVLVSLARAGTPIGVLLTRYLRRVGIDVPHYTASIIRDRGIDEAAVAHIRDQHPEAQIRFVDGWTGKGAIARELARACQKPGPAYGLDSTLAVVADPGHASRLFGTRDDILIPSACLNSTISGLISRTVYRPDLTGDRHGAKYYGDLRGSDVSMAFVAAVERWFPVREDAVFGAAELSLGACDVDWSGWQHVLSIGEEFGISDVNLIKPGIGETLRVLLRRDPTMVLVRDVDEFELRPIIRLATERHVRVEEYSKMTYRACGLIRG